MRFAKSAAPHNSNRGRVIGVNGATLVRAANNDVECVPSGFLTRKYTTAAYAVLDASEKPWSWT